MAGRFSEEAGALFKSSFARSMACESAEASLESPHEDKPQVVVKPSPRRSVPALPTYHSFREYSRPAGQPAYWKTIQEGMTKETNGWSSPSSSPTNDESKDEEILRLRKECQGLMETNRKLQQGGSNIDLSLLQSQVDTLHWQLKQAESNRQMYRAVMDQVSKFLERVHKALESSPPPSKGPRGKHRVPRSRSVHTVVCPGVQSRASSPSPSTSSQVHRANSISQIGQDSFTTWRNARPVIEEVVPPERLSQEAFRLLRTVQSLLSTREPDLARLSDFEPSSDRRDNASMGSCSSLVHSSCGVREETKQGPSTPQLSVGSTEDESGFSSMSSFHEGAQGEQERRDYIESRGTRSGSFQVESLESPRRSGSFQAPELHADTPMRGVRSGSFQATEGLHPERSVRSSSFQVPSFPPPTNERSFHELGLPLVDSPTSSFRHRRWSSTPVDKPTSTDSLTVLWV